MTDSLLTIKNSPKQLNRFKQLMLSSLLSMALLLILTIVLVIAQYLPDMVEPQVEVRQIGVALPPPPPPPAQPKTEQQQDIVISIAAEGSGAALPDIKLPKSIDISKPKMPEMTMDEVSVSNYTPDIEIFNLNQLDGLPTLLTKARITMPASLKSRGVKKAKLRLDVTIDTTGKLTLNRIVENPYDEFKHEIERLIRRSKFSAPQKEGVSVSARFIWPLNISV